MCQKPRKSHFSAFIAMMLKTCTGYGGLYGFNFVKSMVIKPEWRGLVKAKAMVGVEPGRMELADWVFYLINFG